jgi:transposase
MKSGDIFVIRNGLRWRDAPDEYGPHKTMHNSLPTYRADERWIDFETACGFAMAKADRWSCC